MIRPMFGHRSKPKKFDMPLRYYDPKEDEKRKQRIRINTKHNRHRAQNIRVAIYALGLALIIWVIAVL